MTEKKFEAKLRGVSEFPLVKAAFQGKDGNVYIGMMLIDTGSVDCILNKSVMQLLNDSAVKEGCKKRIYSIQSEGNECQAVDFTFKMGNEVFTDMFYVNDEIDFNHMFEGFIGIVGHAFLTKHMLTLDYENETLHSSEGAYPDPNGCEFFFPMEFGLKQYNIPVVGIISGDKEFVMVADSGANNTVLTKHVLDEAHLLIEGESENGSVTGFNNKEMQTTIRKAEFCLLSIGGTEKEPKLCSYKDDVQVLDLHPHLIENLKDSDGNDLLPISGLLSSAFMCEHRWVLDFGVGVMYNRK